MRISPIKAKSGCDNRADSRRRCQVDNRWMLMAENSISGGYAADAVPATSRHVRNAVSRAARCWLALR